MNRWMYRCLELARQGMGQVHPNPMVGSLLLRANQCIAEGWHRGPGLPHAEVHCLEDLPDGAGADLTLVVNLEPCSHHGRTPPCCELVVQKSIGRVICGMQDPNPLVAGRGISYLRQHGVEVICGVLEEECRLLNRNFITHMTESRPRVELKWAQSLDGKISAQQGQATSITGSESRRVTHGIRRRLPAILVGVETVLTDNPRLTLREEKGHNPTRVILDSRARTPLQSKVLDHKEGAKPLVAVSKEADAERVLSLEKAGAEVIQLSTDSSGLSLTQLLNELSHRGLDGLLVEGGARVLQSFLDQQLVDVIHCFVAPKYFGTGVAALSRGEVLTDYNLSRAEVLGPDCRLEYRPAS